MQKRKVSGVFALLSLSLALLSPLTPLSQHAAAATATISQPAASAAISVYGIQLGMTAAQVEQTLGKPVRRDPSTTGVEWWIYNKDLNHYIQIGMQGGKAVTLFTNGAKASFKGVGIGSTTAALEKAWGPVPGTLLITPTLKITSNTINHPTYLLNNQTYTFSIDQLGGNTIAGVRVSTPAYFSSVATSLMYPISYSKAPVQPAVTEEQRRQAALAAEKENIDLLNTARARAKLPMLIWDDKVAAVARAHSEDMARNHYFNHISPTTGSPFDRLKHAGILFGYAGENIAYGQLDGIEVHMSWMNSAGHRQNLLNPHYKQLGVGVAYKDGHPFYTQNFVAN